MGNEEQEQPKPKTDELILEYAKKIGFTETEEMRRLRLEMPTSESGTFISKLTEYQILGEQEVDKIVNDTRPKTQIGLILATAAIYYKQEMFADSTQALHDAFEYAKQIYDEATTHKITEFFFSDIKFTFHRTTF